MSAFEEITAQMADGTRRDFVARRHECWTKLRPAIAKDGTSANLRGDQPLIAFAPGDWPNVAHLDTTSADVGVEVVVEDWNDPQFPTLRLRMTAAGWVVV